MTQQVTHPIQLPSTEPAPKALSAQTSALLAAVLIAEAFPNLPGAYVTFSQHFPNEVSVQAGSLAEVEDWRVALGADVSAVQARQCGRDLELSFEVSKFGALVRVYAMDVVAAGTSEVAA